MAFIVEDGTAKADATAYCTTTFVDNYFADQGGHTVWDALSDTQKQQAIVKATRYIDQRFHRRFRSQQRTRLQSLEWPRDAVHFPDGSLWVSSTEIPTELQQACAEYAVRAASADLVSDPAESREPESETTKVGPISTTITYRSSGRKSPTVGNHALNDYPAADLTLEPLLKSSQSAALQRV